MNSYRLFVYLKPMSMSYSYSSMELFYKSFNYFLYESDIGSYFVYSNILRRNISTNIIFNFFVVFQCLNETCVKRIKCWQEPGNELVKHHFSGLVFKKWRSWLACLFRMNSTTSVILIMLPIMSDYSKSIHIFKEKN